jgi:Flp pilus assembly protein TadG
VERNDVKAIKGFRGTNQKRQGSSQRGASLVEAALAFPILILIVMGTLEIGLAFKDYLTVSYISREGARLGALAGDNPEADCAILEGIGELATSNDLDRIDEIQIYKAHPVTGAQGLTNIAVYNPGDDPTICNVPAGPTDGWTVNPIAWAPTSRQTTVGSTDLDIIGVRVIMTRDWVTGFPPFRGSFTIDESTITRLEPQAFE